VTKRWLALVVVLVAVGVGVWALRPFVPEGSAPSRTNMVDPAVPNSSGQTRGVGAYYPPAAPAAAPVTTGDRFKLVGVVAPRDSVPGSQWVALIAVDGAPARAFLAGATVDGDIVVRDVSARGAILGPREGSVAMALEVSPAPAAATAPVPTAGSGPTSQVPIDSSVESGDAPPRSKYMPLPQQSRPEPENPVDATAEPEDGRWRRPGGP
jgi:general secretion pathway protein C